MRNILIFTVKYAIGVAMALLPGYFEELTILNIGISGAMAGYFLGWIGRLILVYRRESTVERAKSGAFVGPSLTGCLKLSSPARIRELRLSVAARQ